MQENLQLPGKRQAFPLNFSKGLQRLLGMLLLLSLNFAPAAWAQVPAGTYTIGTAPYTTIAAAIALMNSGTGVAGVVTFNVPAGYTETFASATAGRITTTTTTVTKTVIFQKSGTGANPLVTMAANAGTGTQDAIISLVGTDYVTFDGIDVSDANNAAATITQQMEFGYALFRITGGGTSSGCQNNTIKNATVTLNKANTATIGIWLANTDNTGAVVTPGGTSTQVQSSNVVSGNTITNSFSGIAVSETGSTSNLDVSNVIGGATLAAGNTISNIGSSNVALYGIRAEGQTSLTIQYNTITIPTGNTTTNIYGIGVGVVTPANIKSTVALPLIISNNTITISSATTGSIWGIYQAGSSSSAVAITMSTNKVQNMTLTGDAAAVTGIQNDGTNSSGSGVATLTSNEVSTNTTATTNTFTGIYQNGANSTSLNLTGNKVQNNTRSGTNATAANNVFYGIRVPSISSNTTTGTFISNIISGNQITGGNGTFYGMYFFKGTPTFTTNSITSNSIPNTVVTTGDPSSAVYGIYVAAQSTSSPATVNGNTVTGLSIGGTNNSTASAVIGINVTGSAAAHTFATNTVGGLALNAGSGTVSGLTTNVSTSSILQNKFYDISAVGTGSTVTGLNVTNAGSAVTVANNLVGDLRVTAATSAVAVSGISLSSSSGVAFSVYFNTVFLNGSATPTATFGSSALYIPNTSPTFDLRNNILVNNSNTSTTGAGYSLALRGSSLSQYATTSNNNLFYASGGTHNDTYAEGTTPNNIQATLPAFKAYVTSSREANSVTENPPFISTTGTSSTFLHISPSVGTQVESGGATGSGITVDYDNDVRQGSAGYPGTSPNSIGQALGGGTAPDIGADEGTFTPYVPAAISIKPTALASPTSGSGCYTATQSVTVTVQNSGTAALDFTANPLTITLNVTGAVTSTVTTTISTNAGNPTAGSPLAAGASVTFSVGTLNMTTAGTYNFALTATVTGDQNTADDILSPAPASITVAAPSTGIVTASPATICGSGTVTLSAPSASNGTVTWYSSANGYTTSIGTGTSLVLTGVSATTSYKATAVCGSNVSAFSNIVTVTVNTPVVMSTNTPVNAGCAGSTATLTATANGGSTLYWYDTNTSATVLATGSPFVTPAVPSSRQYYVGASVLSADQTAARTTAPASTATNGMLTNVGLQFDALTDFLLKTVVVYPTTASAQATTIFLKNSSGTTIATRDLTVPAGSSTVVTPVTLTLNFNVPAGTGYQLLQASNVVPLLIRENTSPYPITTAGVVSVTNGLSPAVTSSSYYFFYNWTVTPICNSSRTAVQVNVTPLPTATLAASTPVCSGSTATLSGTLTGTAPWNLTYTTNGGSPVTVTGIATSPYSITTAALTGSSASFAITALTDANCTATAFPAAAVTTINSRPTASGSNGGPVCSGTTTTVSFTLTGTSPWSLTYSDGTTSTPVTGITTSPYTFTTPTLSTNTTYTLTALSDANCTASGSPVASTTVTVNSATTWTGVTSIDWFTASNWTNCVPNAFTDATIPSGVTTMPVINSATAAATRNLTIAGMSTLTLSGASSVLNVTGGFTTASASSFTATAGTVNFLGSTAQAIGSGTYYDLVLSGSGSTAKTLGGDILVNDNLDLSNGMLDSNGHEVQVANALSGAGSTHYVITNGSTGRLRFANVATTASVTFPIGTTDYTPASLTNSGAAASFAASVKASVDNPATVNGHYVNEQWDISGPASGANVALTLQWNAADEGTAFDRTHAAVAHYQGSAWNAACATCFGPASGSGPYTLARTGITSFSPFAVEDNTKPLPVELSRFIATRQSSEALLSWATASEKDNAGFGVQVATDGKTFRELHFIEPASANSNSPRSYNYTDSEAGKTGLRYYRLRQANLDGTVAFSPVRSLDFGQASETKLSAAPNPFSTELSLGVQANRATSAKLTLTDMSGRTVLTQLCQLTAGFNQLTISSIEKLPAGLYLVQLPIDGKLQQVKVVKQ